MCNHPVKCKILISRIFAVLIIIFGCMYAALLYHLNRTAQLGFFLVQNNRSHQAIAPLRSLMKKYPWSGELNHVYGLVLMETKQFDRAAEHLEQALKYKFNYIVNEHLGLCYERLGRFDDALDEYSYVLDYANSAPIALQGKARFIAIQTLSRLNQMPNPPDQAALEIEKIQIQKLYSEQFRHFYILEAKMEILYLENNDTQLREWITKKETKNIAPKWLKLLEIRQANVAGNWTLVYQLANELLDSIYTTPQLFMRMAADLKSVPSDNPDDQSKFHIIKGKLYLKGGNHSESLKEFKLALKLNPSDHSIENLIDNVKALQP